MYAFPHISCGIAQKGRSLAELTRKKVPVCRVRRIAREPGPHSSSRSIDGAAFVWFIPSVPFVIDFGRAAEAYTTDISVIYRRLFYLFARERNRGSKHETFHSNFVNYRAAKRDCKDVRDVLSNNASVERGRSRVSLFRRPEWAGAAGRHAGEETSNEITGRAGGELIDRDVT